MKLKMIFLLIASSVLLFISSCSADDAGETAADQDTVFVTVAAGQVGRQLEVLQTLAEDFNAEHPYIRIQLLDFPSVPQEILQRYDQFLFSQDPSLDVLMVDVIWPGDLAEHLLDLAPHFSQEEIDQHFPASIQNNMVDGRLVAMPWFMDAGMLYYRTDLLEQYNRSVPQTWEELEETALHVQQQERADGNQDFWGFIWQAGPGEGLTNVALEFIHSHGGGTIVNSEGVVDVYNPEAIAGLERAADFIGSITPEIALTFGGAEGVRLHWETGNYLFMRNWPYAYSAGNREGSPVAGLFDVAPLPAGPDGPSSAALGGWQLGVSRYSDHPAEAAEVVRYLTSYEIQVRRGVEQGDYPTIRGAYDDPRLLAEEDSPFAQLADVLESSVPRPSTVTAPNYNEFSRDFYNLVHAALAGEMSADEALSRVTLP